MNKQELSALCAAFGPSGREEDVSELIRRIYKVEAEIVYDSRGKMHILFL